jgi:hypothetical protein
VVLVVAPAAKVVVVATVVVTTVTEPCNPVEKPAFWPVFLWDQAEGDLWSIGHAL